MSDATNGQSIILRTERGLSIAGTRITLYALLDYLYAGWSPKLVRDWFGLTENQMQEVLDFIETHREQVEQEYQQVNQQAEQSRQYWEEKNRGRGSTGSNVANSPERAALRAKLQAWKDKLSHD